MAAFVERGGGFLNLHNALGLYPADGPYLDLVGGRYVTHGPLERFRVESAPSVLLAGFSVGVAAVFDVD